jgi:hypothetical protein
LCGVRLDGTTSFSLIQNASDTGNSGALVFFLLDLIHLNGEAIASMPVTERKERLRTLLSDARSPLHFSDHQIGRGRDFYDHACTLKVEGIVSKRVDAPNAPGNRGLWLKTKCLNREEFVVAGWTDPEGSRPWLGAWTDPERSRPCLGAWTDPERSRPWLGALLLAWLINHVVPADQLDEKAYGLARRLAGGAMRSIRWTKQTVNIPLRQLVHSMMDLSLSLETQSKSFQGPPGSGMGLRPEAPAELHRPLSTIQGEREDSNETRGQSRHHLRCGIRNGGCHGAPVRARRGQW